MNPFPLIIRYGRIFTLLVVLMPIVVGTYAYNTLPKEGEPEITVPMAIVITQYSGASPEEIENLVTNPIEESLSDLENVKEIRSSSSESVSVVVVEFDVEADRDTALQKVREKVTDARSDLPEEAEDPEVEEINLSEIPIMIASVAGDMDPIKLKRLAEDVADEIELLPEVLSTEVTGGLTREIQIYLDPDRLNQYGLTILDVYNAVKASDVNIPGGMLNVGERRFLLRARTEVKKVEDYNRVPLIRSGDRVVFVGDVARVVDGFDEDVTYSRVDGRPSVSISVKKRAGANILETSRKVRERIKEIEEGFPQGITTVITADQAKYISQTFQVMNNSAITGLVIVIFVLYFAMGLRNSIITSMAIPMSLLFTFILLKVFGISNNNMVRFSLVLCIGLLVDNAIIVVENAYHHYQLGKDRFQAVVDGTSEIAMPVISATLTTMAAFLPMLLMSGTVGEYMGYMPKTVSLALTSSLIIALIACPLVLSRFMKRSVRDGRIVSPEEDLRRLKKFYVRSVSWSLNHRFFVVIASTLALTWAIGMVGLGVVKIEMFPDVDFDYVYITVEAPPGTDVKVTEDITRQVERIVEEHVPERVRLVSTVGYKGQSAFEVTVGQDLMSNFAEITIELTEGHEFARATHKEIQQRIRTRIEAIPGASIRFRALAWGPPKFAPIIVKVIGPDLEVLRRITGRVKDTLARLGGVVDIKDDFSDAPPELQVTVDREAAASLGVPLERVALGLRGASAGLKIRDFRDEMDVSKKYDLRVRFSPESRTSPTMLEKIKVRSDTGALVPLSNLASFNQGPGINTIRHADRRRVVRATAQNEGRSAVEISKELVEELSKEKLPPGYSFNFEGDYKETEESFASLQLAYMVAFILIFTLLVAQFNSYFQPFAIMTALPLSVVGAMIGLLVTRNNFSIFGFVGLVGLTGIVVNDSIVLVDCINRMRGLGMNMFEAIQAAGRQRLRPIISTTVTTIGGIITLTITDELWEGLGVVIIFGIGFATVLTLVVVPVMYSLFESLGYIVTTAIRGPRWTEKPEGRVYFFSRRRFALMGFFLSSIIAVLVLAGGIYKLGPVFAEDIRTVVLQAPTTLKLVIEIVVFGMQMFFEIGGSLVLLLTPLWIGLLRLMYKRSKEGYYVAVSREGLTVTSPTEKLFFPPNEIQGFRYSGWLGSLTIRAGDRLIRIRGVIRDQKKPAKIPLRQWISGLAPKRSRLRVSMNELIDDLKDLKPVGAP